MSSETKLTYRPLQQGEIDQLVAQGCTARDWNSVQVADPFQAERVVHADFDGDVRIGPLTGEVSGPDGRSQPAGIYRAALCDCTLGANVRVANVGGQLSGYRVDDGALIENIGVMRTPSGCRFGVGTNVDVVNEAGGREVPLLPELSSQLAYMLCMYRYRGEVIDRLKAMAESAAAANQRDYGIVGKNATVTGVPRIVGVDVGPHAVVDSAQALENGTILSHEDAPTTVGSGVIAENFLIAEGSTVGDAAILGNSFVGQGCQVGKQFSAENCLFFANCEAFHGEGCSALAGPYTVTHHKSTLLIGGAFSFYNAGSGTNQSNHRYKLGPTHEGKFERGCKTGSSSYVMWPCRIGPFSVVLGKHTRSFDTANLPFSHLEADSAGRCELIPGHYIATVGTLRDGTKWPSRDRRKGPVRRDVLLFDVFSPLTIGRMQKGMQLFEQLQESTDRSVDSVTVGGATIKRVLFRTGRKRYAACIERYLLEQLVLRLESQVESGAVLQQMLGVDDSAIYSEEWVDVGGQLMPQQRFENICEAIVSGRIDSLDKLRGEFEQAREHYQADAWAWARHQAQSNKLIDCDNTTADAVVGLVNKYCEQQQKFLRLVLVDAQREYDEASQTGFGLDGGEQAPAADFAAVRGCYEDNSFVKSVESDIAGLPARCEQVCATLASG